MKTIITIILLTTSSTPVSNNKWSKLAKEAALKTDIKLFGKPFNNHVAEYRIKIDSLIVE